MPPWHRRVYISTWSLLVVVALLLLLLRGLLRGSLVVVALLLLLLRGLLRCCTDATVLVVVVVVVVTVVVVVDVPSVVTVNHDVVGIVLFLVVEHRLRVVRQIQEWFSIHLADLV